MHRTAIVAHFGYSMNSSLQIFRRFASRLRPRPPGGEVALRRQFTNLVLSEAAAANAGSEDTDGSAARPGLGASDFGFQVALLS